MSKKTSALVFAGNGTNCEIETAHACRMGGFEKVDIVTVWELLHGDVSLDKYDLLNLPGGFLDGDDLGSAKAHANRLLNSEVRNTGESIFSQIQKFINDGKLILGICNGFQLMVKLGLLPALSGDHSDQTVTLTHNDSGKFEDRWCYLKTNSQSPCIFTKGIGDIYLPIRHGEGKFVAKNTEILNDLTEKNLVVFSYMEAGRSEPTESYPANPNGSQSGVAGICDPSGRLMGLMPHPEAYVTRTNHPRWTREDLPEEGMGLAIFRNAFEYVKKNL